MRKTGCAVQYQGITLRTVQLGRMYSSLASPVFVLDLARMRPSFGLTRLPRPLFRSLHCNSILPQSPLKS